MKILIPVDQAEAWLKINPVILSENQYCSKFSRGDWLDLLTFLNPWERHAPTRAQFAAACRDRWPSAGVFIGGHHVAIHFGNGPTRHLMFTCPTVADWN